MKVERCKRTAVMESSGLKFNVAEFARCPPTGSWESWEAEVLNTLNCLSQWVKTKRHFCNSDMEVVRLNSRY